MFLGNVIACTYNFYGKFKNETPYFSSIIYLLSCIVLNLGVIIYGAHLWANLNIDFISSKIVWLTLVISLTVLVRLIYNKRKVNEVVEKYNQKTRTEKKIWGGVSLLVLLVPLAIILFVF